MANDVEQIDGWIQNFWERKYFQRERVYISQIKKAKVIVNRLGRRIPKTISDTQQGRQITKIINFLDTPNNTREQNNLEYIPLELKRQSVECH
jgi:hypothetical protein